MSKSTKPIRNRRAISLDDKLNILERLERGEGSTSVGKSFGLNESTIRTIQNNENSIRKSVISGSKISSKKSSYCRNAILEKMETLLLVWMEDLVQKNIPVNGKIIKGEALRIYELVREQQPSTSLQETKRVTFHASEGWLTGFIKRHVFHNVKIKEEIASADENAAKSFPDKLSEVIKLNNYIPAQVQFTFRGHIAPVFTGFKDDATRSINLEIIQEYAEYLSIRGINGVLVNGTSGEGMSLNVKERKQLAEEWAKACKGSKQTLMVQVGGAPLPDVLELASHAEKLKVDALLCLPELYFKPKTADELLTYLSHVSKAAPRTPLLYYHIPSFSNVNINMPEFLTKAEGKIDTLVGIKFTSTDLVEGAECLKVCNGKYTIFLGADQIMAAAYALGFDSAIATTFNIFPEFGQMIQQSYNSQHANVLAARTAQVSLTAHVNNIIKHGTWVTTMKTAMNILSPIKLGPVRAPLEELTKNQQEEMRCALTRKPECKLGMN